jgi:hypothetical protein
MIRTPTTGNRRKSRSKLTSYLFSRIWSHPRTKIKSKYAPEVQVMDEIESVSEEDCCENYNHSEASTTATSINSSLNSPMQSCNFSHDRLDCLSFADLLRSKSETTQIDGVRSLSSESSLFPICMIESRSNSSNSSSSQPSSPCIYWPFSSPRLLLDSNKVSSESLENRLLACPARQKASPQGAKASLLLSPKRIAIANSFSSSS